VTEREGCPIHSRTSKGQGSFSKGTTQMARVARWHIFEPEIQIWVNIGITKEDVGFIL
jgi:hypothetical protein